jgi:hypothetical protein
MVLGLGEDDEGELVAGMQTVESQLASPRPKVSVIRGALGVIYDISLRAAGSVVGSELAPHFHHLLKQLPHFHP